MGKWVEASVRYEPPSGVAGEVLEEFLAYLHKNNLMPFLEDGQPRREIIRPILRAPRECYYGNGIQVHLTLRGPDKPNKIIVRVDSQINPTLARQVATERDPERRGLVYAFHDFDFDQAAVS